MSFGKLNLSLAGAALSVTLSSSAARAEIIRVDDMLNGTNVTQWQCAATGNTVWIPMQGYGFCMRYYLSTEGGATGKAILHLSGDKLGRMDRRTRNFNPTPDKRRDVDTTRLMKVAENLSRAGRSPAVYLARVGLDGSSGHHSLRHTILELQVTNAALDAIGRKHNFEGFHLVGQSGGASLVGGLLSMRTDIGCAVPGAGRLAKLKNLRVTNDPSRDQFDASNGLENIARYSKARILVVTDPLDQKVREPHQTAFVQGLRRYGRQVEQYFVQATDEMRHGVTPFAQRAVVLCIEGAPSTRIATELNPCGTKIVGSQT